MKQCPPKSRNLIAPNQSNPCWQEPPPPPKGVVHHPREMSSWQCRSAMHDGSLFIFSALLCEGKLAQQSPQLWQGFFSTEFGQCGPAHNQGGGDAPFNMSLPTDRTSKGLLSIIPRRAWICSLHCQFQEHVQFWSQLPSLFAEMEWSP